MSEAEAVLECPQHKMAFEDFDWHPPDDPQKTVKLKRCPVRGCKERPPKSQGGGLRGGGGWRGRSPEELAQQERLAILERASIEKQTTLKVAADLTIAMLSYKKETTLEDCQTTLGALYNTAHGLLAGEKATTTPTTAPEPAKAATPATDAAKGIVDSPDKFWKWAAGLKPPATVKDVTAWLGEPAHVWVANGHTWAEAQAQVLKMRGG